jgi:ketopantoate reductase
MRMAVVGAGGIGAIYGAALAIAGGEVVFVARGTHLAAMRENGLRIEGDLGETLIRPVSATDARDRGRCRPLFREPRSFGTIEARREPGADAEPMSLGGELASSGS